MDINSEHLVIPEAGYEAIVKMPASVFARICKDLGTIGDTGTELKTAYFIVWILSSGLMVDALICSHDICDKRRDPILH